MFNETLADLAKPFWWDHLETLSLDEPLDCVISRFYKSDGVALPVLTTPADGGGSPSTSRGSIPPSEPAFAGLLTEASFAHMLISVWHEAAKDHERTNEQLSGTNLRHRRGSSTTVIMQALGDLFFARTVSLARVL